MDDANRRSIKEFNARGCTHHVFQGCAPDPRRFQNCAYFRSHQRSFRNAEDAIAYAKEHRDCTVHNRQGVKIWPMPYIQAR